MIIAETLENFEVEDSRYYRGYTMPDIKEADLKQLYLEYIKNQDNISKVEVNDDGIKAYISIFTSADLKQKAYLQIMKILKILVLDIKKLM